MNGGCILCGGGKGTGIHKQGGGSSASDAVMNLMNCDGWDGLNAAQSANQVASQITVNPFGDMHDMHDMHDMLGTTTQEGGKGRGSKCRRRLLTKKQSNGRKQKGGSAACDSQPVDIVQPYMSLNPATLPLTNAMAGVDAIDQGQVNAATINTIGQPTGGFGIMDPNVTFPLGVPNMTAM